VKNNEREEIKRSWPALNFPDGLTINVEHQFRIRMIESLNDRKQKVESQKFIVECKKGHFICL